MLRNSYPGHHSPTDEEFKTAWTDGRIVLDTNVLLGLYRYDEVTRKELLDALKRISNRLWMPYQVGLEFNRRRLSVIAGEKKAFDKAAAGVADHAEKVFAIFADKSRNPHPSEALRQQLSDLKTLAEKITQEVETLGKALPDVHERDLVRESISDLYGDRIGIPPTAEWLAQAEQTAQARFDAGIPPGFEDDKKGETFTDRGLTYQAKFGDTLVWLQILDEARTSKWPGLILVTDDAKSDWWSVEAGKTIGPRAELREELQRDGQVPIFQAYSTAQFLEHARRELGAKVSESSIALARDVGNREHAAGPERLERIARSAVRRWIGATVSNEARITLTPFPFDMIVEGRSARYAVLVKFIATSPDAELGPYLLASLPRSLQDDLYQRGLQHLELILVFGSRGGLERRQDATLTIIQEVESGERNVKVRVGSLLRTNDGNYSYVPFDLGIFS